MTTTHKTGSEHEIITGLSEAEQTAFVKAVLEPSAPSARLPQAAQTYLVQRTENLSDATRTTTR